MTAVYLHPRPKMILSKSSDKAPNVWHSEVSVQTILKSIIKSMTASVG